MTAPFSAAYLSGRAFVAPDERGVAAVGRAEYRETTDRVYSGAGAPPPLVVKLGERHIPVFGADDVPSGTMCVPRGLMGGATAAVRTVLIAREEPARRLLRWGYVVGARAAP